jgi:signal peptidase
VNATDVSAETRGRASVPGRAPRVEARVEKEQVSAWAVTVWSLARFAVTVTATLLALAVGPSALGCRSTVVVSGSMTPRVLMGDVLVTRALGGQVPRRGQVLLVDDPAHPGRLLSHRLVRINADGTLELRGDANRLSDSTPVQWSAVRGVALLRIPLVGWPAVWLQEGERVWLVLTAVVAVAAGVLGLRRQPQLMSQDAARAPVPAPGRRRHRARRRMWCRRRVPLPVPVAVKVVAPTADPSAGPRRLTSVSTPERSAPAPDGSVLTTSLALGAVGVIAPRPLVLVRGGRQAPDEVAPGGLDRAWRWSRGE